MLQRAGTVLVLITALFSSAAERALAAGDKPFSIDVWAIPGVQAAGEPSGRLTLQEVIAGKLLLRAGSSTTIWAQASSVHPVHIWVRVPLPATITSRTGPWYLEGSRYLGRANAYVVGPDGSVRRTPQFGIRVPFVERAVARALPTVQLPTELKAGSTLYVDAAADLYYIPLYLENAAAMAAADQDTNHKQRLVLLLCGVFFTLGFCNLLVFASTRERPYLLYSLSMFILAAIGPMQSSALAWEIFWPRASLPDAATRYMALFAESYISVLFAYTFLQTRRYAPLLAKVVTGCLIALPIADAINVYLLPSYPLPFSGGSLTLADLQIAFTTTMWFLIIVLAVSAARARVQGATLVAVAFGTVFVASSIYAASTYYWNDASRSWTYLLLLGARVFEGFALFWALADRLQRTTAEALAKTTQLLEQTKRATTDSLTGISNRRVFDDVLGSEFKRSQRDGTPLSLVMFDIDHFKAYNDTYGHVAGDRCLHAVAQAIAQSATRPGDIVARYGGEEFALVLPGTDASGAHVIASEALLRVGKLAILHAAGLSGVVSVSAGVGCLSANQTDAGDLIKVADAALYAAKAAGRNCICVAPADSAPAVSR